MYESWQCPAIFSSYSIKASASVSGVIGIMHTITCSHWHVVCPQITSSFCLDQDSFHTTVAHCNKYIYKMCLFLLDISECNQKFMYFSLEHTGTVRAKLSSTLNSIPKIRVTMCCEYNLYPLQGVKNQTRNNQQESILRDIFILNL